MAQEAGHRLLPMCPSFTSTPVLVYSLTANRTMEWEGAGSWGWGAPTPRELKKIWEGVSVNLIPQSRSRSLSPAHRLRPTLKNAGKWGWGREGWRWGWGRKTDWEKGWGYGERQETCGEVLVGNEGGAKRGTRRRRLGPEGSKGSAPGFSTCGQQLPASGTGCEQGLPFTSPLLSAMQRRGICSGCLPARPQAGLPASGGPGK